MGATVDTGELSGGCCHHPDEKEPGWCRKEIHSGHTLTAGLREPGGGLDVPCEARGAGRTGDRLPHCARAFPAQSWSPTSLAKDGMSSVPSKWETGGPLYGRGDGGRRVCRGIPAQPEWPLGFRDLPAPPAASAHRPALCLPSSCSLCSGTSPPLPLPCRPHPPTSLWRPQGPSSRLPASRSSVPQLHELQDSTWNIPFPAVLQA